MNSATRHGGHERAWGARGAASLLLIALAQGGCAPESSEDASHSSGAESALEEGDRLLDPSGASSAAPDEETPLSEEEASALAIEEGAGAEAAHRDSVACRKPAGNKTNYSWVNSGTVSVTVHFNNHCSHRVESTLVYKKEGHKGRVIGCLNTNGRTKGKKKFPVEPAPNYFLRNIVKGCPIP